MRRILVLKLSRRILARSLYKLNFDLEMPYYKLKNQNSNLKIN